MIKCEEITVKFEDYNSSFTALDRVSLEIHEGEFLCIVGHSGCGKTTLLRVLAGLQKVTSGTASIDGKEITGPGTDRTVVFQQYSLFPWMTAKKNILFGLEQAYPGEDRKKLAAVAQEYLEKVDMADAASKYPYQLSGGMRQRIAIARALAIDADILLLDEPFGALDARSRASLQQLLLDLWDGGEKKKTVIFVTHDIDEAILLGDRVLFMSPGRIESEVAVNFARPRIKETLMHEEGYCCIRRGLVDQFYEDKGGCCSEIHN